MSRTVTLVLIILLGAWLRWTALAHDARLFADEAWFATFARSAALNGAWMLPGPLDKPPIAIYAQALAMIPFTTLNEVGLPELSSRAGELAARLPGVLASILLIPLAYQITRQLYGDLRTALLTALLLAISPFAVAYSASALTDGVMLMFMAASIAAVSRSRPMAAGALLMLAFAAKQQALLALPLIAGIAWGLGILCWRNIVRFVLPLAVGSLVLLLWDAARGQPTGFMVLAAANNDPSRFIRGEEVLPRLMGWVTTLGMFWGPASALFGVTAVLVLLARLRGSLSLSGVMDGVLAVYGVGYLLLHWLIAFNLYERYLLIILIPAALLVARGLTRLHDLLITRLPLPEIRLVEAVFVLVIALGARDTATGSLSIAENTRDLHAIDEIAAYLNSQPLGTIIYDHWFGWELGYYLGQWTDKRRVYYPDPQTLVEGALSQPDPAPRYWVSTTRRVIRPWLDALTEAGFSPDRVFTAGQFVVYRLSPP